MAKAIRYMLVLMGFLGLSMPQAQAERPLEQPALTTLDAQFETAECARPCKKSVKTKWWMWRTPERVELRKAESSNSELWVLAAGQTSYSFLMHDEKKVIEYSDVDLKMLNQSMDAHKWEAITRLVTQKDLASMKKMMLKKQHQGLSLEQYDGKVNGVETHIIWVPTLQVPLKMTYIYPKQQVIVNLISHGQQDALLHAMTEQALDYYQHIDYVDIGDMEHSASAKVWLSKAAGAPGLHSHHH